MLFSSQGENSTPFLMEVQDYFYGKKKNVVVCGKVIAGKVTAGDEVEIVGLSLTTKRAVVAETDASSKNCILLQGVTSDDIRRGQVLATPGTMLPYTVFWAHIAFSTNKACIDSQPFAGTFRSLFRIRSTDIYGTIWLPTETSIVSPGDQMDVKIELLEPVAMEIGLSFFIDRIGNGTVTRLPD